MVMGKTQKVIGKSARTIRLNIRRIVRWWIQNDRKYQMKWRAANGVVAGLLIMSIALPVLQNVLNNRRYRLSQETLNLVGKNNQALASKLKYNAQIQSYEFNKESLKSYSPADAAQEQVGGGNEKTKSLYALDVSADPKKGVTYHDINSQLSFKLIPQFDSLPAKTEQGRIVIPVSGAQAVYTLKNNGLKEDIVVSNAKQDTLRFTYTLDIPKSLEARQINDRSGAIGIYSGDPTLFSNMSYGSDKDRELVEKARENAEKSNLVFGIPSPVITTADGKLGHAQARFELRGNQLTIVAEGLKSLRGAFSIDPSVIVTSTTDFQDKGNNEGNIDFNTSGQINRASLTGGTVGTWNFTDNGVNRGTTQNGGSGATNGLIDLVADAGVVTYNGVMYMLGGNITGGSRTANVERATINSNGTLGTWTATGTLPEARESITAVAYNGYVYISGGYTGGGSFSTDVKYAAVCTGSNTTVQFGASSTAFDAGSDCNGSSTPGTLSAWRVTTSMPVGRTNHSMVAYNDQMYIIDGCTTTSGNCNGTNPTATVYCAGINGDGTIGSGSWSNCNTTNLSGRDGLGATVYNGFIYVAGGCVTYSLFACTSQPLTVQYSKINNDGTLNNWVTTTTSFTTGRQDVRLHAKNGYLYLMGSYTSNYTNDVQYAPLYASGDVGPWKATTSFNTARTGAAFISYGDYLYVLSGCTNYSTNCGTYTNGVQFVKIDTPGTTSSYTSPGNYETTARMGFTTVVSSGFIYVLGGTTLNSGGRSGMLNTARYAAVNADGTLGSWNTSTSGFNDINSGTGSQTCTSNSVCPGRAGLSAGVYNGYMYVVGGLSNGTADQWSDVQSAVICTGVNAPVSGCAGAGDLRNWTTIFTDFITNSTTTYTENNGRSQMTMQIYNGIMYLLGGYNSVSTGTVYNTIYQSTLAANGGAGNFSLSSATLPSARANGESFIYNNRLYIVGGGTSASGWATSTNDLADVQFVNINSNGTLSTTCPSGYTCTSGGWVDTNAVANGGSGSSYAATNTINDFTANINNGYLYITGGFSNSGTMSSTVYSSKINSNGSLSTWKTLNSLTSARYGSGGIAINGMLYIIGGCTNKSIVIGQNCNSTGQELTEYLAAVINNGGADFTQTGSNKGSFTTARSQAAAVAYNGFIYLSGGCTDLTAVTTNGCATSTNDTRYASIAADGSLTWSTLTAGGPSTNRYGHAMVAYNGYLYVIGGCSSTGGFCSSFLNDIKYVALDASTGNSVGGWATATNSLSTARYGLSAVAYNGYLYAIGGCSATTSGNCSTFQNSIEYAQISTNSSPGTWASTGGSGFTTGRFLHNAVAYGGNMYVLAGCSAMSSGNCSTFNDDVQYAVINTSNGTVGSTWTNTTSLSTARYGASISARNGYLYLIGGCSANGSGNCSAFQSDIQSAPLYANGSLGYWSGRMNAYTDPRTMQASVASNGYLFILGGIKSGPTLLADSQGAALQMQPRVGRYSKMMDLGRENAKINNIVYNGALSDALSSITFKVASSASPTFSSSYSVPTTVDTACSAGIAAVRVRYVLVTVILDDMSGAFGGTFNEASTTNMTDYTLRYNYIHPDPNIRMRLGQTLQENDVLSPFDTCQ